MCLFALNINLVQLYIKSKQVNLSPRQYMGQFTFNVQKIGVSGKSKPSKNPADIQNGENEDPADIEDW